MLGYDISWAAFNVIEVMSSPKFTHKVFIYFDLHRMLFRVMLNGSQMIGMAGA
jgi:hypothetical protein